MKITEQQLFDYIRCPALYDMKHEKELPIKEQESFQDLLRKAAEYIYFRVSLGEVPTMKEIKRKWDSICEPYAEVLGAKKVMEGMSLLQQLFNWCRENELIVIETKTKYAIYLDGFEINGNIGTVISRNGKLELLITSFSNQLPDAILNDLKLKYTIDCYAYEQMYNDSIQAIRIVSVKHNKEFITMRRTTDYERLKASVRAIGKSIEQKLYHVTDSHLCKTCPASSLCKYWYV